MYIFQVFKVPLIPRFYLVKMGKLNLSYETYVMLDTGYGIPCVFLVALILFLVVIGCLWPCRRWGWADRKLVKVSNFGVNFLLRFAYAVFGPPQVVMTFEPARDITTNDIYIDTTQVHKFFASLVFGICAVIVCMFILVTTWNDFLFTITKSCTPNHDCFAFINESKAIFPIPVLIPVPITNCSEHFNSDVEINCFVFKCSFTSAMATFGGLLTATRYISIAVFKVQIWINSTLCNSNTCIGVAISFVFMILGILFFFGNLVFQILTEKFIAKTLANFVHRLTFSLCVMAMCSFPMLYYFRFRHLPRSRPNPPQTPASLEANRGTINETNDERQPLLSRAASV